MLTKKQKIKDLVLLMLMLGTLLFAFPALSAARPAKKVSKGDRDFSGLKIHLREVPHVPPSKIETLYSWSLRDADIYDVLLTFAKGSKTNIIVEPGVSGTVTVDLNMVKFDEVLKHLLTPLGLEYSQDGDFIHVFKPRLKTRIFNLDYVNTPRTGSGSLSVSAAGGTGSMSISSSNSMDFWGMLTNALNTIIFGSSGGKMNVADSSGRKLIVDPQSGVVLVTAEEKRLKEVAEYIQVLQVSVQRQVLIQAKIVEVTLFDDFELGINWSYIGNFPEWTRLRNIFSGQAAAVTLSQGLLPVDQSNVFKLGVTDENITFLLDAMATQGNVNVLSSPQIVTLNNQTAMMKVATEDVYFVVTTTQDPETNLVTETISPKTIDVGITLDVTPQISPDGVINLNIHPSISEVIDVAESKKGDKMPIIDRRETNTVVKVKDGQTIVMAGLMKEKNRETLRMVPCLGEIPFLGGLFRHTVQSKEKVELVLMLTPVVLNDNRIDIINKYKNQELQKSQNKVLEHLLGD